MAITSLLRDDQQPPPRGFSLHPELIRAILSHARPLGHNEVPANLNLGFGFVYYGLARALRPKHVVVIGSGLSVSASQTLITRSPSPSPLPADARRLPSGLTASAV